MSVSSRGLALAAVAALSLTGAAVAVAQTPAPSTKATTEVTTSRDGRMERRVVIQRDGHGGEAVDVRGPRGGRDGRDGMRMRMNHRSPEDRAERLRTLLQLTPAQNGALAAYVAATAPPAPGAFMQHAADRQTPPTAVERADRAAEMAGKLAAEAKKRADATRTFYAALTPSQRKVFDTQHGAGGPMVMRIREMRAPPMPPMPPMPPAQPRTPG
jgi:hypothetical protein